MSERERLAANVRRAEWLAEAALGPILVNGSFARPRTEQEPRPDRVLAAAALAIARGLRQFMSRPAKAIVGREAVQSR